MLKRLIAVPNDPSPQTLQFAIAAIREHLGMKIAYVSTFEGDLTVMRAVDAPGFEHLIKVNDSASLYAVYCRHILAGNLPELITDTSEFPLAMSLPLTEALPIGSHISVPLRDRNGVAIGMFCCLSPQPNSSLSQRDLQVMRVFADIIGEQVITELGLKRSARKRDDLIDGVIADRMFTAVFQPIWSLQTRRPVGVEALSRFSAMPYRSPDAWFADAVAAGRGVDLELEAVRVALPALRTLPPDLYLSVNASATTIRSGRMMDVLADLPLGRIIVELTEHEVVEDYDALVAALVPLRQAGLRIAIDDAGAGFASLQHILRLQPDIIKLDMSLTRSIDVDPARRALATAMVTFARETGATLIAEGVETRGECEALIGLGVQNAQGYFLGKPGELETTLTLLASPTSVKLSPARKARRASAQRIFASAVMAG
ncbi:EAL domain, c-di-GMP-specific phosphodiesterase class I (or its enzymatically inactive variant) [Kaistia soli DSM 19436]|uniref:EAL domain, c-di-GMP-specific phosphodiesterase class I (Or its enzymatically inactive variant) n=1 Tax=Kaistia soli DSM 19436 TaxID=1122133 RepID=A0A1M5AI58_9HYPH|nr:EAL domain-containing protein [Kaistia soli]SHF29827.1 EAL domain, c-di-GMP-specific phosphodiesterase class I (or its enzymatically inactive variant) [Kaistia soli DSM 19436]